MKKVKSTVHVIIPYFSTVLYVYVTEIKYNIIGTVGTVVLNPFVAYTMNMQQHDLNKRTCKSCRTYL